MQGFLFCFVHCPNRIREFSDPTSASRNQKIFIKTELFSGTKLDDEFYCMEKKSDLVVELVDDLQIKTKEYLQPNPTVRAKMGMVKGISKLSGQAKASTYPQPEGTLGEAMLTYGNKLTEYDRE